MLKFVRDDPYRAVGFSTALIAQVKVGLVQILAVTDV